MLTLYLETRFDFEFYSSDITCAGQIYADLPGFGNSSIISTDAYGPDLLLITQMINSIHCVKVICNCHFSTFCTFSKIDCHILFTITCHGTLFDIEIVMRMILLKNITL